MVGQDDDYGICPSGQGLQSFDKLSQAVVGVCKTVFNLLLQELLGRCPWFVAGQRKYGRKKGWAEAGL